MREQSLLETNPEQTVREEFGKQASGGTRSSLCVLHLFPWADAVGPRWYPGWHTLCPRASRRVGDRQKAGSPKEGILGAGAWVLMCVIGIFTFMLPETWFYFTYRLWFRYGRVVKTRSYSFLESLVLFMGKTLFGSFIVCTHTESIQRCKLDKPLWPTKQGHFPVYNRTIKSKSTVWVWMCFHRLLLRLFVGFFSCPSEVL